ncbi:hypothetical protein TthSNM33_21370 (plasmid) [Thermus thermophilus]|nr:hypothetical protein TthSNM33_21370 [Thermus thermophilus]
MVEGDLKPNGPLHLNPHRVSLQAEVGPLCLDEKGVSKLALIRRRHKYARGPLEEGCWFPLS